MVHCYGEWNLVYLQVVNYKFIIIMLKARQRSSTSTHRRRALLVNLISSFSLLFHGECVCQYIRARELVKVLVHNFIIRGSCM